MVQAGAKWIKFKDITSEAKFQLTFLYVLQVINMALPLAYMNFDFSHEESILSIQQDMYFDFAGPRKGGKFFFGGRFKDTNRLWLNQIN